jgi:hypothetical protein
MSCELPDSEWIERFNEMSDDLHFDRYVARFKPLSAANSIILPSDRYEIKIGLNLLSKDDKNKIKSIEMHRDQILAMIIILEKMIRQRYDIMKQQCIEKAIKYFNENDYDYNDTDYNDITVQFTQFLRAFDVYEFPFHEITKIIEMNQQKTYVEFRNRLLSSLVPFLVELRDKNEFNNDIKNIAENLLKRDINMIIMDIATEIQRREITK